MTISKSAARLAAKKPSRRNKLKNAKAKRAMPLRTRDPVRTVQVEPRENGPKPTKRKRPKTDGREASSAANDVTTSRGLFTTLMQWSPLGIFLRQQAFLADAMSQAAQTTRR